MSNNDEISGKIQREFMKLYAKKAVHQITVKELTENAGIARTAFYKYYSDVYEVLESIEDILIFHLKEMNKDFYLADVREQNLEGGYFNQTLLYIKENADWFRILLNKGRDGQFIYRWKKIIKEDFSQKFQYDKAAYRNEELMLEMIASAGIGMYMFWVNNLDKVSVHDIEKEALLRLFRGFL